MEQWQRTFEIWFDRIQKYLTTRDEGFKQEINQIQREQRLSSQISQIDTLKQIVAQNYQSASAYSNLIIIAGYAGLFGVWQFTRSYLSKGEMLLIALMGLISIIIFTGYEVYKMISGSIHSERLTRIVEDNKRPEDIIAAYRHAWAIYNLQQSKIWKYQIIPSVLFGFFSGLYLVYVFVRDISSGIFKNWGTTMTLPHIGIILTILGTIFLAFSVVVKRQHTTVIDKTIEQTGEEINLSEITETRIVRWRFWLGLLLIAVGSLIQW